MILVCISNPSTSDTYHFKDLFTSLKDTTKIKLEASIVIFIICITSNLMPMGSYFRMDRLQRGKGRAGFTETLTCGYKKVLTTRGPGRLGQDELPGLHEAYFFSIFPVLYTRCPHQVLTVYCINTVNYRHSDMDVASNDILSHQVQSDCLFGIVNNTDTC